MAMQHSLSPGGGGGGGGGGYSLYEGYYICSSVSTALFQVSGKFVEFRPLYFSKNEENVVFWPLYFSKNEGNVVFRPLYFSKNEGNVVFRPLFFIKIGQNVVSTPLFYPCSVSSRRAVRSIPTQNLTEYPPPGACHEPFSSKNIDLRNCLYMDSMQASYTTAAAYCVNAIVMQQVALQHAAHQLCCLLHPV